MGIALVLLNTIRRRWALRSPTGGSLGLSRVFFFSFADCDWRAPVPPLELPGWTTFFFTIPGLYCSAVVWKEVFCVHVDAAMGNVLALEGDIRKRERHSAQMASDIVRKEAPGLIGWLSSTRLLCRGI